MISNLNDFLYLHVFIFVRFLFVSLNILKTFPNVLQDQFIGRSFNLKIYLNYLAFHFLFQGINFTFLENRSGCTYILNILK